MSNILRFDQFKEGYVFEQKTLYRENISSLKYLDSRLEFEKIDESILDWPIGIARGIWNGVKGMLDAVAAGVGSKIDLGKTETYLHTAADIAGVFGDYLYPGLGAGIDIIHAMVYFGQWLVLDDTEANKEKKQECLIAGTITLVCAIPILNPFQLLAKGFIGPFKWIWNQFRKPTTPDPITIKRFLEKNQSFSNFVEMTTKNLDTITKELDDELTTSYKNKTWWGEFVEWIKKGVDQSPILKSILDAPVKFFRWIIDLVLYPFKLLKKLLKGGSEVIIGKVLTKKIFKFIGNDVLANLYKGFMRILPGFPKTKKIRLFDDMFEGLSQAQKNTGYFKSTGGGKYLNDNLLQFGKGDVLMLNANKGSNKATVIISGSPSNKMRAELTQFWEEEFERQIKAGNKVKIKIPPGKTAEQVFKETKEEWVKKQVNSSCIKEIDKSFFLQKWYKQVEEKYLTNAAFKIPAAITKFLMSIFVPKDKVTDNDEDSEDIAPGEQPATLSEPQVAILLQQMANDQNTYDFHYEEEDENTLAENVYEENISLENTEEVGLDIDRIVWETLAFNLGLELPDDNHSKLRNYNYEVPLSEFQRKNGLKDDGKLNKETLTLLRELNTEKEYLDFLDSYLYILSQEQKEEENPDDINKFDQEENEKDQKEKNRSDRKQRRREKIKNFGRYVFGMDE